MASTTKAFLETRVSKPTIGRWSSGFTACKNYADEHKIPLIGVWSNGDACGHCINFEKTVMNSTFTDWMATSGCVFWFGCSSDTSEDDKMKGTGSKWAKDGKLTLYPFVRVWWEAGKVDVAKSGDSWTGGTAKGWNTFIKNLKSTLKNYDPSAALNESGCTGGDCNESGCDNCGECGDCSECEEKIADAVKALEKLSVKCSDASADIAAVQSEINALIEALSK